MVAADEPCPPDRRGGRQGSALARTEGLARARRPRAESPLGSNRLGPFPSLSRAPAADSPRGEERARLRPPQRPPRRARDPGHRSFLVRSLVRRLEPQAPLRVARAGSGGEELAP